MFPFWIYSYTTWKQMKKKILTESKSPKFENDASTEHPVITSWNQCLDSSSFFFILCVTAQGSKGIESKGVWAQRSERLRLSSFSLNEISLWEPEHSQHGQQKSCQTVGHTSATKGSWGYWQTTDEEYRNSNVHIRVFWVIIIVTRKKCIIKAQTEREICVYGNVMVQRCPRRSHMKTGRGHGEKGSRRERGKRGREIEK